MIEETIKRYQNNIRFLQRLMFAFIFMQIGAAVYYLFIPSIVENSLLTVPQGVLVGIIATIFGILIGSRMIDLQADRSSKLLRVACFGAFIQQYFLGINTIYPITIFVLGVIGEHLVVPNLEIIQRTQNFASHQKMTEEVFSAIAHTDTYLGKQLKWITNTTGLLFIVAIISIILVTLVNILPVILHDTTILQYFSFIAFLALFVVIIKNGFPEFLQPEPEYEIS